MGELTAQAVPRIPRKDPIMMARQTGGNEEYERREYHHMAFSPITNQNANTVEESGLTTTYDLPGTKNLSPRPTHPSSASLGHIIITKSKPVAYLKAKIRITSRLTLLKGETGLTPDDTFLGRTRLPRCSDGDILSCSLGIYPAIKINYPKVDVRRTITGLFSRENSSVYMRSVTVSNTRAAPGKPVSLLVLDQLPVSEAERLKVNLLVPKGLVVNGSGVSTGRPARGGKDDVNWGKAAASLKKGGQIDWQVALNAGRAMSLNWNILLLCHLVTLLLTVEDQ
ncbi:mucoidy inhibitor-like protein [Colletotrichum incanum]|uniref:Mucoidy inhibitor-like protein n=1 Tax=Colletotrichum incanum TaxID=1573173 RepID=A0A166LQ08_COLIC|nr:mucoidy inhibitor-like protein [Colletotrichum incanum]